MANILRMAAVGAGGIGHAHQSALMNNPKVELVAICDIAVDRAKARAESLGIPHWYGSIKEMLANEDFDAVTVVTADNLHFEPTMECLDAGKHVIGEKPLAMDVKEAELMVAKAKEKGVKLAIDYNRRFSHAYKQGHKWLKDGEIGNLAYITLKLAQGGPPSHMKGEFYLLWELETHAIDLLRWFGGEIVAVSSQMGRPRLSEARPGEPPLWTSMAISVRFANDAVASYLASYDSDYTHPIERLEARGNKGALVVDNILTKSTLMRADNQIVEEWRPNIFSQEQNDFGGTFKPRMDAFVEDVLAGCEPYPNGNDGLQAVRVVDAIIRSWQERKEILVKID